MLTGSGVALILRVVGTPSDDPWNTYAWEWFAIIAGLSLMTKYVIKWKGSHVFNPSNIGLVAAFLILGAGRVEPLDFWWGPLDGWMILAYAVILGGGLLITRRLKLLGHGRQLLDRARRRESGFCQGPAIAWSPTGRSRQSAGPISSASS